jgi:hypothetical protein
MCRFAFESGQIANISVGLFVTDPPETAQARMKLRQQKIGAAERLMAYVRRNLFDWFVRRR